MTVPHASCRGLRPLTLVAAVLVLSGCLAYPRGSPSPHLRLPDPAADLSTLWTGHDVLAFSGVRAESNENWGWALDPNTGQTQALQGPRVGNAWGRLANAGFDGGQLFVAFPPKNRYGMRGQDQIFTSAEADYSIAAFHRDGQTDRVNLSWPPGTYSLGGTRDGCSAWGGAYGYRIGGMNEFQRTGDTSTLAWNDSFIPPGLASRGPHLIPTLPGLRYDCTAVWTGAAVYVFGGRNETTALSTIVRLDVRQGILEETPYQMPGNGGLVNATAVWNGQYVYLFGGRTRDGNLSNSILRFDPTTGAFTTFKHGLPSPRSNAAAVLVDDHAFVLGGRDSASRLLQDVVSVPLDPAPGNRPPVAAFDAVAHSGLSLFLNASASSDADGPLQSYCWDFGDQAAAQCGAALWHDFVRAGHYRVTLTVEDHWGGRNSSTRDVQVPPP